MRSARSTLWTLALFSLCACSPQPTNEGKQASKDAPAKQEPAAEASTKTGPPTAEPLQEAMGQHFARATQLELAVVDGDLEVAIEHAKWIAEELPKDSMPASWQPHLTAMQAAAGQVASADTLPKAAMATGELVAACGACHQTLGTGPKLPEPGLVPEGEGTSERMQRHQWAAARMREGMIGNSEVHWQAGAGAVSVAPPEPCEITNAEVLAPEVLKLRERIYEIGAEAAAVSGAEARARAYGEYLTTCAGCHVGGC